MNIDFSLCQFSTFLHFHFRPPSFSLVYASVPPSFHCPLFSLFLHVWLSRMRMRKPLLFSNSQSASFPFICEKSFGSKIEQCAIVFLPLFSLLWFFLQSNVLGRSVSRTASICHELCFPRFYF